MELTEAFIKEGFAQYIKRGITAITVVPLLLLAAGYIKKDIPEALLSLQQKYPQIQVAVADPFGVKEQILDQVPKWSSTAVYEAAEAAAIPPLTKLLAKSLKV